MWINLKLFVSTHSIGLFPLPSPHHHTYTTTHDNMSPSAHRLFIQNTLLGIPSEEIHTLTSRSVIYSYGVDAVYRMTDHANPRNPVELLDRQLRDNLTPGIQIVWVNHQLGNCELCLLDLHDDPTSSPSLSAYTTCEFLRSRVRDAREIKTHHHHHHHNHHDDNTFPTISSVIHMGVFTYAYLDVVRPHTRNVRGGILHLIPRSACKDVVCSLHALLCSEEETIATRSRILVALRGVANDVANLHDMSFCVSSSPSYLRDATTDPSSHRSIIDDKSVLVSWSEREKHDGIDGDDVSIIWANSLHIVDTRKMDTLERDMQVVADVWCFGRLLLKALSCSAAMTSDTESTFTLSSMVVDRPAWMLHPSSSTSSAQNKNAVIAQMVSHLAATCLQTATTTFRAANLGVCCTQARLQRDISCTMMRDVVVPTLDTIITEVGISLGPS